MKNFTSTPLSVKSVNVDGYKPTNSTTNPPVTVAEMVAKSPALIWGPVPQKKEPVSTKEVVPETFIEKIIKAASQVAPNVTSRLLGYIK